MAIYSKGRSNYLKDGPQKNDDLFEVMLLGDKDGNVLNTFGPSSNIPVAEGILVDQR